MKPRIKLAIAITLLALILISACTSTTTPTGEVVQDQEEIKIGGAFALGAGFAAGWGEEERNGATLAIEEINAQGGINGKKVRLDVEDTAGNQKDTVTAVRKLISIDNVEAIIGPTWMDTYSGATPLSDEHKIVMITPSASITAIKKQGDYPYVFSTYWRTDAETKSLAEHFSKTNKKRIVLFFESDAFWQDIKEHFKKHSEKLNLEIVDDYTATYGETDFRTSLTKIKQQKPDAVFFGVSESKSNLAFLRQRLEISPDLVIYSTESISEYVKKDEHKPLMEGIRFIRPADIDYEFVIKYFKKFGKKPLFSAANAYDATNILLEAIKKSEDKGTSLLEELRNNDFETITYGKTRFDSLQGLKGAEFVIKEVKDGKIIMLEE
ncbi:ABC transporter substrate-binding protein [Candidatus Woesearchaeota archaeon]|nr:ABC transporter substrate-binding protein [Candidatus Woesearchaeota archaeon]